MVKQVEFCRWTVTCHMGSHSVTCHLPSSSAGHGSQCHLVGLCGFISYLLHQVDLLATGSHGRNNNLFIYPFHMTIYGIWPVRSPRSGHASSYSSLERRPARFQSYLPPDIAEDIPARQADRVPQRDGRLS